MRLHALELEQFRKFDRPVRLSGFSDRLNLLCGPNEFGKSTILAAIRGLMFERHNSRAEPIRQMQPRRGNAAPRLAMEFDVGDGRWRIEKRFIDKPMAALFAPDGSRFDGDAAEEELQRLLGFGAAGKQGAKPEHMGMWGALWVEQRKSLEQANLANDLARATINTCLDSEVGVLTGSEKGQAVMRAARAELDVLHDRYGKPKGRYKQVVELLAELDGRLVDLRARAQALSEDADALRQARATLEKTSDQVAEQQDREQLEEARHRKTAAELYEQRLQTAQAAAELARKNLAEAESERDARATRAQAISSLELKRAAAEALHADARAELAAAEAALGDCRRREREMQARLAETQADARKRRAVLDLVRLASAIETRSAVLAKAEAAQERVNAVVARLASVRVSKARVAAIRKAANEYESARSVCDANATWIDIDVLPDAIERVSIDAVPLQSGQRSVPVVADIELAVAGVGRFHLRPGIRDRDKLLARLRKADDALRAALSEADCVDLDEAEGRWTEREALEAELRDGHATLNGLAPGDATAGLDPGVAALREQVDVDRRRLQEEQSTCGLTELPSPERADDDVRTAEDAASAADLGLKDARSRLDAAATHEAEIRVAVANAANAAARIDSELTRLRTEAAHAEAREAAPALAVRVEAAGAECQRRDAELATLARNRTPDTPENMQARIDRLTKALDNRRNTIGRLKEEIARLSARIEAEGFKGLDEQIATDERKTEMLTRERDEYARQARSLQLLVDALADAERETKERYLVPVIRRISPYLRTLFPGAEVACDDALRITGLKRDVLGVEEFDRLSDGTQEQLAVLARLAFAEMLIDQGKPAMVILDDALAYSDGERIERMFDILAQAGSKMQILILTCREDLFARLGGNPVQVTTADPLRA